MEGVDTEGREGERKRERINEERKNGGRGKKTSTKITTKERKERKREEKICDR